MAQKTIVSMIDDLDGRDADESITFALDGATYDIDLSEKNATTLRTALAPFVDAARRTGGRARRTVSQPSTAAPRASLSEDTAAIRKWARTHGHKVSDRGRIAARIVEAYAKAH